MVDLMIRYPFDSLHEDKHIYSIVTRIIGWSYFCEPKKFLPPDISLEVCELFFVCAGYECIIDIY